MTPREDDAIDFEALFATAARVQSFAYAPYSRFKVGAAILADDGVVYPGCNVENAAYPSGSCAEQGAISAMIATGGSLIAAILVFGEGHRGGAGNQRQQGDRCRKALCECHHRSFLSCFLLVRQSC